MGFTKREILVLLVVGGLLAALYLAHRADTPLPADPQEVKNTVMPAIYLNVCKDGTVLRMELEQYITGVVLAEMDADFEEEALKAQAIVARTFACKSMRGGKHSEFAVCTEPSCCQGYRSEESYLKRSMNPENVLKIRNAVAQTAGLVITYEGQLIEATYFSCSGGRTEDAQAVWGRAYPYLTAKESPGEEGAFCYTDTKVISVDDLMDALNLSLTGEPSEWFQDWRYTAGGGVASVTIGGRFFFGTELRRKLGLRSTAFSVQPNETAVVFQTRGFGHRVGMSQYGADAMAVQGHTCKDILSYYYEGTEIMNIAELTR